MTEMTKTGHVAAWFVWVAKVGVFVWSMILLVLGLTLMTHLYQDHHWLIATGLLGTMITLLCGTIAYLLDRAYHPNGSGYRR